MRKSLLNRVLLYLLLSSNCKYHSTGSCHLSAISSQRCILDIFLDVSWIKPLEFSFLNLIKNFPDMQCKKKPRGAVSTVSPNTASSNIMLPKHIDSKKDQRPPGGSFILMIPQLYSPTPAHNNSQNYIKLIISKIVFK